MVTQSVSSQLVEANILLLDQGRAFLEQVPHEVYTRQSPVQLPLPRNSIGAHMRHVLDLYTCLIRGYSHGLVDFTQRDRNPLIESDPKIALEHLVAIQTALEPLGHAEAGMPVEQITELSPEEKARVPTTLGSLLSYARDHTIHHYAPILILAAIQGYEIKDPFFGYNPSTVSFHQKCAPS